MKRNMKYLGSMLMIAGAALCASCSSDSINEVATENEAVEENLMRFEAVHPAQTRVTDTNFESGDGIGVYVTANGTALQLGGNEVNNALFTYDGSAWASTRKLYWNTGNHDVYAYYPYSESINDTEDYSFSVSTDQTEVNGVDGYEASDFLWASSSNVAASSDPVKLTFSHCMSKAVVELVKGEDYEGNIPSGEVYIHNTVVEASIDLSTGGVSKANTAGTASIKARKISNTQYCACVVPQNIETRRPLVEFVADGVSYLMEGKISFKQGYQHTITVTLSQNPEQTKIDIGGSIGEWE